MILCQKDYGANFDNIYVCKNFKKWGKILVSNIAHICKFLYCKNRQWTIIGIIEIIKLY